MNRYLRAYLGHARFYAAWKEDLELDEKDLRYWEYELEDAEDALTLGAHERVWGYAY